jgi:ParB family chromosome partitioning protein
MANYEKGKLYQISIGNFIQDPDQPRKIIDPESLEELTASIRKHGILQPLIFRNGDQGLLYIVAGERRYQAAKKAGLTDLPAICVNGNTDEIALVENIQRQDLTAVEEAEALQRLKDDQKYTDEQLSSVIGKARTTISETLSLNRLPKEIRDDCRGNRKIAKSSLIEIARKKQERSMFKAYRELMIKQAKDRKPRAKNASAPQAMFVLLDKVGTRISIADTTSWSLDDRNKLVTTLMSLCNKIDARIAALMATIDTDKKPS